jgi:hypothetical protein
MKTNSERIVIGINKLLREVYGERKIAMVMVWSENASNVADTEQIKLDLTTNMGGKTSPVYFLAQAIARIVATDPAEFRPN